MAGARIKTRARVCVGGTFDILHEGHRRLLFRAAELSGNGILLVGVTSDHFASSTRDRAIRPYRKRAAGVAEYLDRLGCGHVIVEIEDLAGPSASDEQIKIIVVSEETRGSGERINEIRRERGLAPMRIVSVDMVKDEEGGTLSASRLAGKAGSS